MFLKDSLSQSVTSVKVRSMIIANDTILIDSLSLVANSEIISISNEVLDDSKYIINYSKGLFILSDQTLKGKENILIR